MPDGQLDPPCDDFLLVVECGKRRVCARDDVWNRVLKITKSRPQEKGLMLRCLERWAQGHNLTREQFVKEGNFPDGAERGCPVFAFKAFQLRCYGSQMAFNGRDCFFIVGYDLKKRDRADKNKLNNAGKALQALRDEILL